MINKKELSDYTALYKEELPKKKVYSDMWLNLHKKSPQQGRQLEAADAQDTLMGRLATRMASRDMIDELDLGPKGRTAKVKQATVADNSDGIPRSLNISNVPKGLRTGKKIEKEHKNTVDALKKNPKMTNQKAYESIAKDHLKEYKNYYDDDEGLPALERKLNETADITMPGRHEQTSDVKASNFSNPIPNNSITPGSTMEDQARKQGNVWDTMHKK